MSLEATKAGEQALVDRFEARRQLIRDRVRGVQKRYHSGLYLCGRSGASKTFTVLQAFRDAGVEPILRNGHLTGAALFNIINDFRDRDIVLDDVASLFQQKVAMQILMAATDGVSGTLRYVQYRTDKKNFNVAFTGSIICISNLPLGSDPLGRALENRLVVLDHNPEDREILAFIRHMARQGHPGLTEGECVEVADFIVAECLSADVRPSLRFLDRGFNDRLQHQAGESKTHWRDLVRTSMRREAEELLIPLTKPQELDAQRQLVRELLTKFPNDVRQQIANFPLGRSTFYQRKREVETFDRRCEGGVEPGVSRSPEIQESRNPIP